MKKLNVDLVAVSTDSAFSHFAWHKSEKMIDNITFPLLADTTKEVTEMFNLVDYSTGFARRATVIISPEGQIVVMEVVPNSLGRSGEELLRKVQSLVHMEKNEGHVCPANWTKDKKSLDPSKLVIGDVFNSINK